MEKFWQFIIIKEYDTYNLNSKTLLYSTLFAKN